MTCFNVLHYNWKLIVEKRIASKRRTTPAAENTTKPSLTSTFTDFCTHWEFSLLPIDLSWSCYSSNPNIWITFTKTNFGPVHSPYNMLYRLFLLMKVWSLQSELSVKMLVCCVYTRCGWRVEASDLHVKSTCNDVKNILWHSLYKWGDSSK